MKKRYELLLVSTDFGGGVSRIVREIGSCLNEFFKVKVYSLMHPLFKGKHHYDEEVYKGLLIKMYPGVHIARAYLVSFSFLSAVMKQNPDLVHAHHYGYFPATCGFLLAKIKRKPFVISTYLHPPSKNPFNRFLFYLQYYTQGIFTLKFADAIIVSTKLEKKIIEKYVREKNKVLVIPNPIDTQKFLRVVKKSGKKKIVLYAGLLHWTKGADIFFEIAKKILDCRRDVIFVMIGKGGQDKKFDEKLKAESKHYKGRIRVINEASDSDLIEWYSKADIFVSPTYYESFGLMIAEAMACETPVISTKVGAVPEVVPEGKGGFLVDYGNWKKMEEKINYLLDNPDLRRKMGEDARKFVVDNFELKKIVKSFREVYLSLLNKNVKENNK